MRKFESFNLKKTMAKKLEGVATVVRGDGKEFIISKAMVAEHVNRGFTVKNKADQPTDQELKNAVGFKGSTASSKAVKKEATVPEKTAVEAETTDAEEAPKKASAKKVAAAK